MRFYKPNHDLMLFDVPAETHVVNVASVPQRSPFRYPGGKTWLVPRIRQWLRILERPTVFVEPFAGGAIVGLTVAFEELAERVVLVELDSQVAAAWQTILSDDNEWLADRILSFDLTKANVQNEVNKTGGSVRERGFRTILKNRTFHGGIMAPGSSLIKMGENGKGLRSRWYAETLARRICAIAQVRERITFVEGDGIEIMRQYQRRRRAAFFIDPPYTAAGKKAGSRLYLHHALDHERLFEVASRVLGAVLMTYDDAPEVAAMAARHGLQADKIVMKNTHHAVMTELLIEKAPQVRNAKRAEPQLPLAGAPETETE